MMLALALLFTAPGATAADMSWPIMNNSRFKIEIQFYSRARNLVWPGYGQVWYAWPGQNDHPDLALRSWRLHLLRRLAGGRFQQLLGRRPRWPARVLELL